ncbi:MAG: class F sortase [Nocardioides sp.]
MATGIDGSLGLPEDPRRLGWWTGGSAAGAPYGSVVLAGHLDSWQHGLGFASRLTELARGDLVEVSDDDQARRYRVRSRYLLPRTRLSALAALFSDRGPARLVLITCGGTYDRARRAYSDNLVVEATPLR